MAPPRARARRPVIRRHIERISYESPRALRGGFFIASALDATWLLIKTPEPYEGGIRLFSMKLLIDAGAALCRIKKK